MHNKHQSIYEVISPWVDCEIGDLILYAAPAGSGSPDLFYATNDINKHCTVLIFTRDVEYIGEL